MWGWETRSTGLPAWRCVLDCMPRCPQTASRPSQEEQEVPCPGVLRPDQPPCAQVSMHAVDRGSCCNRTEGCDKHGQDTTTRTGVPRATHMCCWQLTSHKQRDTLPVHTPVVGCWLERPRSRITVFNSKLGLWSAAVLYTPRDPTKHSSSAAASSLPGQPQLLVVSVHTHTHTQPGCPRQPGTLGAVNNWGPLQNERIQAGDCERCTRACTARAGHATPHRQTVPQNPAAKHSYAVARPQASRLRNTLHTAQDKEHPHSIARVRTASCIHTHTCL